MSRLITLFAGLVLLPSAALGQDCPTPAALKAEGELPAAAVRYLAHDALEGRLAGSDAERCAAEYVAARFGRIGLEPAGEDGGWFQRVPLASAVNPHAPTGEGRNVLGLLRGVDPELAEEVVVLGAHLDHLGTGGFGSLAPTQTGAVHNGADDNASGVAALLRAAEMLASGARPSRSILFLAFTGEEFGLLGSSRFVTDPTIPLERIRAMVNMDMVGRLEGRPLIVYGVGTAEEWEDVVGPAAQRLGLQVELQPDGYGPSDHTSFYRVDIPVLHLFTNTHADYHKPSDDAFRIDYAGLEKVAAFAGSVARQIAGADQRLTLVRGAGSPPRAASAEGGYGAYLGSIPDFAPVERGVKLGGVRGGSPAAEAGLIAGDIIVGFGTMEIGDLYDLTEALRTHRPGETVEVRVVREGEELTLRVTLGERA